MSRNHSNRKANVQRVANGDFTFHHKGKQYSLPSAAECAKDVPAGVMIDAVESGTEEDGLRLGLATLKSPRVSKAARDALREKTTAEFSDILSRWLNSGGVNPGKSR
jgi:hypothetical protein